MTQNRKLWLRKKSSVWNGH